MGRRLGLRLEAIVALVAVVVLHPFGLVGVAPLGLTVLPVLLFGVTQLPGLRDRRLAAYLDILITGWVVYAIGWGPVLPLAFGMVFSMHIRAFGGRLWRPVAVVAFLSIAVGQAGIALGWIFCYLPPVQAQVTGLFGALLTVLFIRILGTTAEERERTEALYQALVQDSSDVYCVVGPSGELGYISPAVRNLTGYDAETYARMGWQTLLEAGDVAMWVAALERCVAEPDVPQTVRVRLRHADGGLRWVESSLRDLTGNPAVRGIVANLRDVTERVEMQERLTYEATYDQLTGLHNRAAFLRGLAATPLDGDVAVLFVDLDGFKAVNDTHGHMYGDALLTSVAAALRSCVRDEDLLGRLGGDEFGVVLTSGCPLEVAARILAALDRPVTVEGVQLRARASVGVAVAGEGCRQAGELLHRADLAMYEAKRSGTHGVRVYELEAAGH
ncbi:sensor domain-containing diguanylate cyclase [Actinoplanes sp. NPDC048796]|uniref:sensor domain-containing diguanylate cyclase n=1 Tax=Actinoplanes sp. NPDC048796 TaxID=3155640 RepID=UPI0033F50A3D